MTHSPPPPPVAPRVAVGSMNPVKIGAVHRVFASAFSEAVVDGVAVASGVPEQPWGDDETIRGAVARASAALEATGADFGVGIEGGVVERGGALHTCAWAAVVSRDGRNGVGGSLSMPLPPSVARLVRAGAELGHAIDAVTGERETKRGRGAVGVLTAGLVTRERAYEVIVAYAMAPFLGAEYWSDE